MYQKLQKEKSTVAIANIFYWCQSVGKFFCCLRCLFIISGLTLYIAKRANLFEGFKVSANGRAWLYILLGFLVLYLVKILGGITLTLEGLESTSNQVTIENAGMHPLVMILLTVIVAPIVEETVFRGFIMGRV